MLPAMSAQGASRVHLNLKSPLFDIQLPCKWFRCQCHIGWMPESWTISSWQEEYPLNVWVMLFPLPLHTLPNCDAVKCSSLCPNQFSCVLWPFVSYSIFFISSLVTFMSSNISSSVTVADSRSVATPTLLFIFQHFSLCMN